MLISPKNDSKRYFFYFTRCDKNKLIEEKAERCLYCLNSNPMLLRSWKPQMSFLFFLSFLTQHRLSVADSSSRTARLVLLQNASSTMSVVCLTGQHEPKLVASVSDFWGGGGYINHVEKRGWISNEWGRISGGVALKPHEEIENKTRIPYVQIQFGWSSDRKNVGFRVLGGNCSVLHDFEDVEDSDY